MTVPKNIRFLGILLIVVSLLTVRRYFSLYNNVLGRTTSAPLMTAQGAPITLDFNTPTPSPTPTPTNTPTPTITPSPTPTPFPVTSQQLDEWFTNSANHYSVDRSLLFRIAVCETGLRPNATNWIYGGLFQFSPNTWIANRELMGMDSNPDLRFNPEEAIRTAAFVLSTRGAGAWPNCSKVK